MRRSTLLWLTLALAAGGATWTLVRLYGSGALRAQAVEVALVAALFAYLARHIRLSAPQDRHSRSRAALTRRAKAGLLALFGLSALGALSLAVMQGLQGYAPLPPEVLLGPDPPTSGFHVAEGKPQLEALYRLGGPEGERFLVPLDAYAGRLLIVLDRMPPATAVRVTGRLRDDIRTVQTSADGQTEGPFLPLYREHVRLPPDARVFFLDTAVRAGLNLRAVLMVLVPAYLFLLTLGAATRRPGPPMRVGPPPRTTAMAPHVRPGRKRAPQRGRR